MNPDVLVIGAGVSGLSSAITLLSSGYRVKLLAAEGPRDTTSAVAAAIWHPFFQRPDPVYLRRAQSSFARLAELAAVPDSGVVLRRLTEFFAQPLGMPWWMAGLDGAQLAPARLPAGYAAAYQATVPLADTSRYLDYLWGEFLGLGGQFALQFVSDTGLRALRAHALVNCTGFSAGALVGDTTLGVLRGMILVADKDPAVTGCLIDDNDPMLPTYVFERRHDIILGGTADPSLVAAGLPDAAARGILERCARLHPAVAGLNITARRLGFRPMRSQVRVERDARMPRLIHNYGHGGAGFTLSWGCADEVRQLVGQL